MGQPGKISQAIRNVEASAGCLPITTIVAPLVSIAYAKRMLAKLVHNFLGIETKSVVIAKGVLVISETLAVENSSERCAETPQSACAVARASVIGDLEDVR